MAITRRGMLGLVGGGAVLAAGAGGAWAATRTPRTATLPWSLAGGYEEPRRRALSWALLAPNPHNRQPWVADLREPGVVTLHADLLRLLPHTDPVNRQVTIGLGCFLEVMRMAAAADGFRVDVASFPEGEDAAGLDGRPVARTTFTEDPGVARDPLFAFVPERRSNKEPFDTARPVDPAMLDRIGGAARFARFGASAAEGEVAALRALTREALRIEVETPHTYKESVDLFRIGRREVDANPDGIDFSGPLFQSAHLVGAFTREAALERSSSVHRQGLAAVYANADTAMGHMWLVTPDSGRATQLATGADWVRVNLACAAEGLAFHPLSQALQEYPEMAGPYREVHDRLARGGGTVQMLARVGFGPEAPPSPRWPLEAKVVA